MPKKKRYKQNRPFEAFGLYLRNARIANSFTQREVSHRLRYSSAQFISNFERGLAVPPTAKLKILIAMYKLQSSDLIAQLVQAQKAVLEAALAD